MTPEIKVPVDEPLMSSLRSLTSLGRPTVVRAAGVWRRKRVSIDLVCGCRQQRRTRISIGNGSVFAGVVVAHEVVAERDLAARAEAAAEQRVRVVHALIQDSNLQMRSQQAASTTSSISFTHLDALAEESRVVSLVDASLDVRAEDVAGVGRGRDASTTLESVIEVPTEDRDVARVGVGEEGGSRRLAQGVALQRRVGAVQSGLVRCERDDRLAKVLYRPDSL